MDRSSVRLPAIALEDVPEALGSGADTGDDPDGPREADSSFEGSGGGDEMSGSVDLGEAVRQAERLTAVLHALQDRERAAYRLDQETMERIRRLERSARQIASVHNALQEQLRLDLDDDEFGTLESLLHAWTERPNDLLVMVKLAEQSTMLAQIVAAFREIRQLVSAVDADSPAQDV